MISINDQIQQIRNETIKRANTRGRVADALQTIADQTAENTNNLQLVAPSPWYRVPQGEARLCIDTGIEPTNKTPFKILLEIASNPQDYYALPLVVEVKGIIEGDGLISFASSVMVLNLFNSVFSHQIDDRTFGYSLTEGRLKLYLSAKDGVFVRLREVVQVNGSPSSPTFKLFPAEGVEYKSFWQHFHDAGMLDDYFSCAITQKVLADYLYAPQGQGINLESHGDIFVRQNQTIIHRMDDGTEETIIQVVPDVGYGSNTAVLGSENMPMVIRTGDNNIQIVTPHGTDHVAKKSDILPIPESNTVDITNLFYIEDGAGNPIPSEFVKIFVKETLGNETNLVNLHYESSLPLESAHIRPIMGYGLKWSRQEWMSNVNGEAVSMDITAEAPDSPTVFDVPLGVANFDLSYQVGSEDSPGGASYYTRMVNGTSVATPFTIADRPIAPYMFSDVTDIIHINFGKDYEGTTALPDNFLRGSSVQTLGLTGLANVTTIGSHAFAESNLLEYTFPVGMMTGGGSLFKDCVNLRRVFYNAVSASSVSAASTPIFEGCTAFTDIYIGDNVVVIPSHLLRSTPAINVHFGDNPKLRQLNTAVFANSAIRRLTLPATFNYFQGTDNFNGCRYLEEVIFIGNVTSIPANTFRGCIALPKITLPASVKTLGTEAFYSCTNLESVVFEGVITSSGTGVFAQCNRLSEIEIPTGLPTLPTSWLAFCYALKTLFIPKNITAINNYALRSCTGLLYIVMQSEEPPVLDAGAFTNASQFNIYVPDAAIGAYHAAPEWSNLQHRILPLSQLL